jgi:hypothetical protein
MSDPSDNNTPEKVGYGKPPKHSRFQKGNSGNLLGRPSKPKSTVEAVARHLDKAISVRMGRRKRRITQREVLVHKLFDRALDGDLAATRILLSYDMASRRNATEGDQGGGQILSDGEIQAMLDAYVASRGTEGEP